MERTLSDDIPEDQRYSEKELHKIADMIYSIVSCDEASRADLEILDTVSLDPDSNLLYNFLRVVQNEASQKIIKYVKEGGRLPLPVSPISIAEADFKSPIEEYERMINDSKDGLDKIKVLISYGVITENGAVNEKLNLDDINSVNIDKVEGSIRQRMIDFANKVEEFNDWPEPEEVYQQL